jgi:hypothetical protein
MPPASAGKSKQTWRTSAATKGKEAAAADPKQTKLAGAFTLVAKLPSKLPAQEPAMPKPAYKPHPLGRAKHPADDTILLEVNACVHRLIDIIILDHEKEEIVINIECRSTLNSIVDLLVLEESRDAFYHLKPKCVLHSLAVLLMGLMVRLSLLMRSQRVVRERRERRESRCFLNKNN